MHKFVYHAEMSSIKNMEDVFNFRIDELVIPLEELELLVPDELNVYLTPQMTGTAIFSGDEVLPRLTLSSQDKFYRKIGEALVPVNPQEYPDFQNTYLSGPMVNAYCKKKYLGVHHAFSSLVRLSRSQKALRKILAVRTVELYIELQEPHAFTHELQLPALQSLYPLANEDRWREHFYQTYRGLRDRRTNAPLFGPNHDDFKLELLGVLGCYLGIYFKAIDVFMDQNRDCLYSLEVRNEKLHLVRGIDHKYLPYYEKKYPHTFSD